MITLAVNDIEVKKDLDALAARCQNLSPAMKTIGQLVRASIRQNFRAGGRPSGWKQSERAKRQRGQTLRDTNRLYNSFTIKAETNRVSVGTNVEYAAAHNFGANKTVSQKVRTHTRRVKQAFGKPLEKTIEARVKAHVRQMHLRIVARPFMLLQSEDWLDIKEAIANFITRR